jgi:hypothetical protein
LEIKGSISSAGRNLDNGQRTYTIDLFFEDIDGNKYMQPIINGKIGNIEKIEK